MGTMLRQDQVYLQQQVNDLQAQVTALQTQLNEEVSGSADMQDDLDTFKARFAPNLPEGCPIFQHEQIDAQLFEMDGFFGLGIGLARGEDSIVSIPLRTEGSETLYSETGNYILSLAARITALESP